MLTPEEIEGLNLPRSVMGGFKPEKVNDHLRRIAWDVRRLLHEHAEAETELGRLRITLARSKRREELEAVVFDSVQRLVRDIREAAIEEAELVVKKANEHASRVRHAVEREHAVRTHELEELKNAGGKLRAELRTFITSLLEVIEPEDLGADTHRLLVMADLDRVVHATRAAKPPRWDKAPGHAPTPEIVADSGPPPGGTDMHVVSLTGELPADGAERVA